MEGKVWWQEGEVAGWSHHTCRQEGEIGFTALSFSFSPGPRPMGPHCSHSGWVFLLRVYMDTSLGHMERLDP